MIAQRILVTGSSGFLGSAIAARLRSAGHHVIGLDPLADSRTDELSVRDDLSNEEKLTTLLAAEKISHVIHAGGVSGPMVLADQPARIMAINVSGSLNLLQAALASGVKTFVFCSSISAVGDYYEDTPIDDEYPLRPVSAYGCSKAAVDLVLRGLYGRIGLDLCSLRFTGLYGPGRRTEYVIDDVIAAALEGRSVRVPDMTDWSHLYIDDAADATIAACLSEGRKQLVYFLAYPEQVALSDLAAAAGAPALDIDRSQRLRRGPVDIAPARRDFGFDPKIDHREGIRRMLAARRSG